MGKQRRDSTLSHRLVGEIKKYWRERADARNYHPPKVRVDPMTFYIESDMKNGYPPLVPKMEKAR